MPLRCGIRRILYTDGLRDFIMSSLLFLFVVVGFSLYKSRILTSLLPGQFFKKHLRLKGRHK